MYEVIVFIMWSNSASDLKLCKQDLGVIIVLRKIADEVQDCGDAKKGDARLV